MKVVSRILAVLSVLALATPALACACGDKAESTKSAQAKPSSQKVAKAGEKKPASHAKHATEAKPATAAN